VKGGRERTIPIPQDVKNAVDDYLRLDQENRRLAKTGGSVPSFFKLMLVVSISAKSNRCQPDISGT
jgi:hypothetical protein